MRWLALGCLVLAACGGTKASCSICDQAMSDDDCMALAPINGCEEGHAYEDTLCSTPTQGCEFTGCGTGEITCALGDAETDTP